MTHAGEFTIQALVTQDERPAVASAARLLSDSLSAATHSIWRIACDFPPLDGPLQSAGRPTVVRTSLVRWLEPLEEDWQSLKARLQSYYGMLAADPNLIVFACTILRHIGVGEPDHADPIEMEAVKALRVRIRQLNLFAIELSREMGVYIVDIDRDLADVGARTLKTDFRLRGDFAAEAAGKSIAMALLLVGLDDIVPFEAQEAARERARAYQPAGEVRQGVKPTMVGGPATVVRSGRRMQIVETTVDPVDENFVALQIRRLLKGQISARDAAAVLAGAIARRGWRQSFARLIAGLKKAAILQAQAKR
jgi:hypothetical protein